MLYEYKLMKEEILMHFGLSGIKSKLRLYYTCINFLTEAVSNPVGIKRQSRTGNYTAAFSKNTLHLEMYS